MYCAISIFYQGSILIHFMANGYLFPKNLKVQQNTNSVFYCFKEQPNKTNTWYSTDISQHEIEWFTGILFIEKSLLKHKLGKCDCKTIM